MKYNIQMYKHVIDIQKKRRELREALASLDLKIVLFNKQCQHDVIFKISDHHLYSVGIIETCYCPICGKTEEIHNGREIEKTQFRKSIVVDLTKLQVANVEKALNLIHDEVVQNINFYYNEENEKDTLESKMYDVINKNNKTRVKTDKKITRTSK